MRLLFFLFLSFFSFAQQTSKVDFKTANGNISINPIEKKVFGSVKYVFEVKEAIDTIKIDGQKMTFTHVKINNREVKFLNSGKALHLFEGFKKGKNTVIFDFEAFPKQTMYFNGDFSRNSGSAQYDRRDVLQSAVIPSDVLPSAVEGQIWTQGQGKYTSHWFPSFDDVNEKVIFNRSNVVSSCNNKSSSCDNYGSSCDRY